MARARRDKLALGAWSSMPGAGSWGGRKRSLRDALAVYGGGLAYADNILALARPPAPSGPVGRSGLEPISCPHVVLTQGYGPTDVVGEPIINGVRFHTGWDLACPAGTPVVSVTAGRAHVTLGYGGGFGNDVQVQVGDLWIRYAHLEAALVGDGDVVAPGTVVGLEGSTGFSTGPHLHFEVDRGCPGVTCSVDPAGLIALPGGG